MEQPSYTHPLHLAAYNTERIGTPGAELDVLTDLIDEVIYPETDKDTVVGVSSARSSDGHIQTHFTHEFLIADGETYAWPLESVRLSVDHAVYLGRAAIKQSYKVQIDTSVLRPVMDEAGNIYVKNRVTTHYYLEEIAGPRPRYFGTMLRPNMLNDEYQADEPMTVYDCNQLINVIAELASVADHDDREAKACK